MNLSSDSLKALHDIWWGDSTIGDLTKEQRTELDALYESVGETYKADNFKDFVKSKLRMLYIKYANTEVA